MGNTVIRVENLYKEYRLGVVSHGTLTHDLQSWWARIRGKEDPNSLISEHHNIDAEKNSFLALKDISFEVKQGDRVGIIGKNGAGKSTLLKIMSKITSPTRGQVKIKGRVGSLLEVGTGFHTELTGRENIYLNGAILGMSRKEIDRKFDEIVDFSGIEKHIDTPVKRYSSGMNVRLGFAVAAHLDPEILIVDEVLAVGDAEFQKKAIGKMEEVSKGEGRTILFVSHNMGAILQLCSEAILLDKGEVVFIDKVRIVVNKYMIPSNKFECLVDLKEHQPRVGNGDIMFESAWVQNSSGDISNNFYIGDNIKIIFKIKLKNYFKGSVKFAISIKNSEGILLCNMIDSDSGFSLKNLTEGQTISVSLNDVRFYPDTYYISFWAGSEDFLIKYDYIIDCLSFNIIKGGGLARRHLPRSNGFFFLTPEWSEIK